MRAQHGVECGARRRGERLIVCRKADLARERPRKREDLFKATERDLAKIASAVSRRDQVPARRRLARPPASCSTNTIWPNISN